MHGNPTIRVLVLIAALAVTAVLVRTITRHPATSPPSATDPTASADHHLSPALLTVQFSAPAQSLAIRSRDGQTVLVAPHAPGSTGDEFHFNLPLDGNSATLLFDLAWESPAPNRFLRLVLECDELPTRELTIHAPTSLENHAITFTWSDNPDSP